MAESGGTAPNTTTPTAANIADGFATATVTGATTLVTVPAGRTWVGYVGASAATAVTAAGTVEGQATAAITTANGTGTPTPAAGTYCRTDAVAGANAAGGTAGSSSASAVDGQRLVVVASAGGTALIQLSATIAGGTGQVVSGWALGELQ